MRRWVVGVAIAIGAFGVMLWTQRPYRTELAHYRTSLADRTPEQRLNILTAARELEGVVLEPGATWSFNATVGPRTRERGYALAPAYMDAELVRSLGGGICQVSSTLYNAAALADLEIVERHPHPRRIQSVPPGRDATVWYGKADLRLVNTRSYPVRLAVRLEDEALDIAVWGSPPVPAVRLVTETRGDTYLTTRQGGARGGSEVLSCDHYQSAP